VFRVPRYPLPETAETAIEAMTPHLPALVVSLNDAGHDFEGRLARLLIHGGSYIVNWYYDYPFYEQIHAGRRMCPSAGRIDFVTEETFVAPMREKGFTAHFLPLATDPRFFNDEGTVSYERDVAFVGNSSLELMDSVIDAEVADELENVTDLIARLKASYYADPTTNIRAFLLQNPSLWQGMTALAPERFLFAVEWLVGFFYRRDFVAGVAARYGERFTCFGDAYWRYYLGAGRLSSDARYYDNLCRCYRGTRINLNVNRVQIRTSVNQRVFDCKASGAFLLSERREGNRRFFVTEGPAREFVEFDSMAHCHELIDYYLTHEQEREAIARAGRRKVLANHTYEHRLAQLLSMCRTEWGI
jgi:spore maturation protein CgeB